MTLKQYFTKDAIKRHIILIIKGVAVGFGAIMPGISGGTLCVAFGMYQPLLEVLSHPRTAIRKHWLRLSVFLLGAGIGFIGLSGLAGWMLGSNSQAVTYLFIGLIIGTMPELWRNAGQKGRNASSGFAMLLGFVAMLGVLLLLRHSTAVVITPDFWGFLLCGFMWGISFIVPGLSSSTILLFFGLYQPMLDGISKLSFSVLIPLAIGAGVCLLVFPKAVNAAYRRWHSGISHAIIGIVAASTVMIVPFGQVNPMVLALNAVCVCAGAVLSYAAGRACLRLEQQERLEPAG